MPSTKGITTFLCAYIISVGVKEIELHLIEELLDFYTFYVEGGDEAELRVRAKDINARFHSASPLVSDLSIAEVFRLVTFFANTGIPWPTKIEASRIVEKLRKRRALLVTYKDPNP